MGAAPPIAPDAQAGAPGADPDGGLGGGLETRPEPTGAAAAARVRIALLPAGARRRRARLLAALEQAYAVRFEEPACGTGALADAGFDGVLVIGGEPPADLPAALPCLHALGEERREDTVAGIEHTATRAEHTATRAKFAVAGAEHTPADVELAAHDALARPLRGARLTDRWIAPLPAGALGALAPGHVALATIDGSPAWTLGPAPSRASLALAAGAEAHRGRRELLAAAPAELAPGEALRERLAPGRCLALLALVHFVRRVARDPTLDAPLDAAFVLDDPNLHRPRYGHVRYGELARHARAHGYHMAIAMPPIDGWFAHRRAVRSFREHPAELSLCIHGNDHLGPELGRVRTAAEGLALGQQALARAAAFERRTGIPFEPVMVPPHEQLSESAARGLLAAGFLGVCVSRPYPWIEPRRPGPAAALSVGPPERGALAGWSPRELVAGGLPVLLRSGFDAPREDLALRAFLGQPLIVYGHHDTLADGLDVLAETTAAIEELGDVRWGSLARIAQNDRESDQRLDMPHDSEAAGDDRSLRTTECPREIAPSAVAVRRPAWRPLLRRLASEARDRARV